MPEPDLWPRSYYLNSPYLINGSFLDPQTRPVGPPLAPSRHAQPKITNTNLYTNTKPGIKNTDFKFMIFPFKITNTNPNPNTNTNIEFTNTKILDLWFSLSKLQTKILTQIQTQKSPKKKRGKTYHWETGMATIAMPIWSHHWN